jgi:hypothetical protein
MRVAVIGTGHVGLLIAATVGARSACGFETMRRLYEPLIRDGARLIESRHPDHRAREARVQRVPGDEGLVRQRAWLACAGSRAPT